jgi:hypothetical protein
MGRHEGVKHWMYTASFRIMLFLSSLNKQFNTVIIIFITYVCSLYIITPMYEEGSVMTVLFRKYIHSSREIRTYELGV